MDSLKERASALKKRQEEQAAQEQAEKNKNAFELACTPISLSQVRSERHFMRYPLFSTDQKMRFEPIEYRSQDGTRYVTVTANATYGMATQRDADVLRYAISKLAEAAFLSGGGFTPSVAFTRYEVLKAIGKDDQKKNYQWLDGALNRLANTGYTTNIFSANPNREHKGPLATFEVLKDPETQEVAGIAVHFAPDVVSALKDRGILAVTDAVLLESGDLKKRLFEVVQVHMGENPKWEITLSELAKLCAYSAPVWRLKERINRSELPYKITYRKGRTGQVATFVKDARW